MQVTLNPLQAEILETLVQQGLYPSWEVALNAALLQLLDEAPMDMENSRYQAWVEQTCDQIHVARSRLNSTEIQTTDEVLTALRAKVQQAKDVTG